MVINRKDFQRILEVMDRFDLREDWDAVDINYIEQPHGYDLKITLTTLVKGIMVNIRVDIVPGMFGEDDEHLQ